MEYRSKVFLSIGTGLVIFAIISYAAYKAGQSQAEAEEEENEAQMQIDEQEVIEIVKQGKDLSLLAMPKISRSKTKKEVEQENRHYHMILTGEGDKKYFDNQPFDEQVAISHDSFSIETPEGYSDDEQ